MAKAWVTDRWVKDAAVTMPDGSTQRISPTSQQMKSLKSIPDHFRTAEFGVGSRWQVRWYELDDGGEQKARKKQFKRRTDADEFAAELEDDVRSGRYVDPSMREQLFRDVVPIWLASKARLKGSSLRRYNRELKNYVLPKWGNTKLGAITRPRIDEWVQQLRTGQAPFDFSDSTRVSESKRKPRPMAPSYIEHLVSATFGGVIRYAVNARWLTVNPLQNVELPRILDDLDSDLPHLSYGEVELLAAAATEVTGRKSDGVLLRTQSYRGPRIGESTALKVKDFDADGKRVRIHRTWTVDEHGARDLGPVKNFQKRWLPLGESLALDFAELCEGRDKEDFIFRSARGEAVNDRNWYNRVWVNARKRTGLASGLSVHDLRHVAATLAIGAGADVKLVQQMLGHKDATETLNTYAHLWPDRIQEVADLMESRRNKALEDLATKLAEEGSTEAA